MKRLTVVLPLALLAACSSEPAKQDELVTLDGGATAVQGTVSASAGGTTPAPATGVQAVDAEGSKLEPLLSSAIGEAGLETGACRFSPAQGALPPIPTMRCFRPELSARRIRSPVPRVVVRVGSRRSGET